MTKAIRIHETGGPEVLSWEEIEVGDPEKGQVRLRQSACGLNYIDVYGRSGMYPVGDLPAVIGMEASGVVEAVGDGVDSLAAGDRVAYPMTLGSYSEARLINADKLVKIPDSISDETAAAMMLKGLTAHYLLFRTYPVKAGDSILVYAAAGGVGLILCQWANQLGANVIGCVGSEEKAQLARDHGCHHTILYRDEDISSRVPAGSGKLRRVSVSLRPMTRLARRPSRSPWIHCARSVYSRLMATRAGRSTPSARRYLPPRALYM
jgi:NADPH2:quinone reductase